MYPYEEKLETKSTEQFAHGDDTTVKMRLKPEENDFLLVIVFLIAYTILQFYF